MSESSLFGESVKMFSPLLKKMLPEPLETAWDKGAGALSWIREKADALQGKKVEEIEGESREQRESLFGEVTESLLTRYFPNVSKLMDLSSTVGLTHRDVETHPLQNEFETLTAFSLLVPDFLLKHLTDPLAHSETFLSILEHWPLKGEELAKKIREEGDPDDVINALRLMHQDLITGIVTWDKMKAWLPTGK